MKKRNTNSFIYVFLTHFVPCFFLGVVFLLVIASALPGDLHAELTDQRVTSKDLFIGTLNGLAVACVVILFHLAHNNRVKRGSIASRHISSQKKIAYGALMGFIGGGFQVLFGLFSEGIVGLTTIVLGILIWHIRVFSKDVILIIKPGNHATWSEVMDLMRIYLTMVAGFTLFNATLEVGHLFVGETPPFGFGTTDGQFFINSLYFTVVTMTTLGYGDIVPKTWDGKLFLIFQCLASYIMFALMVGIITRGVNREQDELDNE